MLWTFSEFKTTAAEPLVQNVNIDPAGSIIITHRSDTNCYYILFCTADLEENTFVPTAIALGTGSTNQIADYKPSSTSGFYVLREVRISTPLDTDGDGIDDVTELRNPGLLNPLNTADAADDPDHDGRSNLQEYNALDDPELPTSNRNPPGSVRFTIPHTLAMTGDVDTEGRVLGVIDEFPSLNDNGWVAVMGKTTDASKVVRRNLFTIDPNLRSIRPLLNTATSFELPELQANEAPAQLFTAPMVNNQDKVFAWRRMNAKVQIGFPFGDIQNAPLTYIESWLAKGNEIPGQRGMPVKTLASGDAGVGSIAGLLFWINPITSGTLPSPYNPASGWTAIQGRRADAFPAVNNKGQSVYCGLGDKNYLTTTALSGQSGAIPLSGDPRRARIADDGTIVTYLSEGGPSEIAIFSYNLKNKKVIASTGSGFSSLGLSPTISDDGTIVVFYGTLNSTNAMSSLSEGPGVFAALRTTAGTPDVDDCGDPIPSTANGTTATWTIVQIADTKSRAGDVPQFAGFPQDAHCGASNSRRVVYLAKSADGSQLFCSSRIDLTAGAIVVGKPTIVAKEGDPIIGHSDKIKAINIYDPINNHASPDVVFWAAGTGGAQYLLGATEALQIDSNDRMLRTRIALTSLTGGRDDVSLIIAFKNKSTGQTFGPFVGHNVEGGSFALSEGFATGMVYPNHESLLSEEDVSLSDSQAWRKNQQVIFVGEHDPVSGAQFVNAYALFDKVGDLEISITQTLPNESVQYVFPHTLEHDAHVSALLDTVDEHIGAPDALPGAPAGKDKFQQRTLVLKTLAPVFDSLKAQAARFVGGIDGFWSGAKGDYEGITGLFSAIAHPIKSAQAIRQMLSELRCVRFDKVGQFLSNLWGEFLEGVDTNLRWYHLEGGQEINNAYIEGFLGGYGLEQWGSTLITAGLGKAIIKVAEAAKLGQKIASVTEPLVDLTKKGVNAIRYKTSRYLPRGKLSSFMARIEDETGAILIGGKPAAERYASRVGTVLSSAVQEKIERQIATYPVDLAAATYRRLSRVIYELGDAASEDALVGFARYSGSMPLATDDEIFETLLKVFSNPHPNPLEAPRLDKTGLARVMEQFSDTTSASFKMHLQPNGIQWVSDAGLIYADAPTARQGHRINHVFTHSVAGWEGDLPPKHTVFNVRREELLPLLDEAWGKPKVHPIMANGLPDEGAWIIDMQRPIDSEGRSFIRLIVKKNTSAVITAYPWRP